MKLHANDGIFECVYCGQFINTTRTSLAQRHIDTLKHSNKMAIKIRELRELKRHKENKEDFKELKEQNKELKLMVSQLLQNQIGAN